MRSHLRIVGALLAMPITGIAQEVPSAKPAFVIGPVALQDEVPPGPAWPRGALIGGLVGGGAGLVVGFVACSQKTVNDPTIDPTGREERPSDCVIAIAAAGLVVGALVGHAIDRGTQKKGRWNVGLVGRPDRRIAVGASIAF